MKFIGRQTAGRQRGSQRAGPRHTFHAEPRFERSSDNAFPGITDARSAGIAYQRKSIAVSKLIQKLTCPLGFVEFMAAQQGAINAMGLQELPRTSSVLRGNHAAFAQCANRAQGDIFKVANGCGNEIQRAGLKRCGRHGAGKHGKIAEFNQIRIAFWLWPIKLECSCVDC